MMYEYETTITLIDGLALARATGLDIEAIALRLDVTPRRVHQMAKEPHHSHRLRLAVYELLAERERLEAMLR